MPRRFALSDLRTMCQQRCDRENDDSISTTEWNRLISTSWAELYALVAGTGLRYFETVMAITSDGTNSYQEPTDHMATVSVDRIVDASGHRYQLRELMAQERDYFSGLQGDAAAWELVDDQLRLYPTPPPGQSYEWLYVPQPPQLAAQADSFIVDVVTPDGESFVVWGVAVQALAKEDSDTALARAERDAVRGRVWEWATLRNLNMQRHPVMEHYGSGDYRYGGWGYRGGGDDGGAW